MDLSAAKSHIQTALTHLEQSLGEAVFDEWVLAKREGDVWELLEYQGPRREAFKNEFAQDMLALREVLDLSNIHAGDFAFSHDGYGSAFDAYMSAGDGVLILFNHTTKSTGDITRAPKWKAAQVHFNNLLEVFLVDPVV